MHRPSLTRRAFFRQWAAAGQHAADEIHISSLVIHARPDDCPAVRDAIARMAGAEVHAVTPTGKLIVTLETDSEQEIAARLSDISGLRGVLSANLVFHQCEPETPT